MQITDLPFGITNWAEVPNEEHSGTQVSLCGAPGSLGRHEYVWLSTASVIWSTIGARRDIFF